MSKALAVYPPAMPLMDLRFTPTNLSSQGGQDLPAQIEADENQHRILRCNPRPLIQVSCARGLLHAPCLFVSLEKMGAKLVVVPCTWQCTV